VLRLGIPVPPLHPNYSGRVGSGAVLTEAAFRSYLAAFNRSDFDAFGRFYAAEVEFFGRAAQLKGRDEVVHFYRGVKSRVWETVTLHGIVVGPNAVVADLETELHAFEDWPDFPTGPLNRGDVRRSQNFVWYDVADDRFTRIRSAHYRRLGAEDVVPDMAPATTDSSMSPERFAEYIDAFNRGDYSGFGDYYDENVVLDVAGKRELRGRQAIFDFYRTVRSQTQRTIEIVNVLSAGNRLAAELQSEFLALEDLPNFTAGPMKKGGRIFINTLVLYELRAGRFARIRSAELRKIAK
jgi:ketosteroid isomerase-like protein